MTTQSHNLSEIRSLLMSKRGALEQRHRRVEHDLQRRHEPLVADADDRAIQVQNDETLQAIDDATRNELAVLDEALQRLELGLYGICKVCGAGIDPRRLKALHAVTCATCAKA